MCPINTCIYARRSFFTGRVCRCRSSKIREIFARIRYSRCHPQSAPLETIEDTSFNKVLNAAISCLPIVTRTRQNNLSLSSRCHLPTHYRLYPEHIPVLSTKIKHALKSLSHDDQLQFGQQQCITPPLTIRSLAWWLQVFRKSSTRVAIFHHSSGDYSVFWHATEIAIFLRGKRVVKYPLMVLVKLGVSPPVFPEIKNAWPLQSRGDIHLTHAKKIQCVTFTSCVCLSEPTGY